MRARQAILSAMVIVGLSGLPVQADDQTVIAGFIEQADRDCRESGAEGKAGPGFVSPADINGDGKTDFILDYSESGCATYWCGTAGCLVSVMVSGTSGYTEVFSGNLHTWSVEAVNGKTALVAAVHGSNCNKSGAEACSAVYTWKGNAFEASFR